MQIYTLQTMNTFEFVANTYSFVSLTRSVTQSHTLKAYRHTIWTSCSAQTIGF
ncbi:hypothetical protein SAMN05216436_10510 [bacterium A37T11]|nr:hypothetical protein SAMN05216436_10510 [bacterium A37T11]